MNTTAARRRTRRSRSVAELLHRRLGALERTRLVLWAGLLHRLARALAAVAEELARRQRLRDGAGPGRGRPVPAGGPRPGPPRPAPARPTPQESAAALECHHRSLSRADVLTGAPAPHEVGWPAAAAVPVRDGGAPGTWANATRTRGRARPTPSRCLLHRRSAPRPLRYEVAARCSPTGPWRSLR